MKIFKIILYTITVLCGFTVLADCPDSHIDFINCQLNDGSEHYVSFSTYVGNCSGWLGCQRCHNDWQGKAAQRCKDKDATLSGKGRAHFDKMHGASVDTYEEFWL